MFIDENTSRDNLEIAAAEFMSHDDMAKLDNESLLSAIQDWIAEGDECGGAA